VDSNAVQITYLGQSTFRFRPELAMPPIGDHHTMGPVETITWIHGAGVR
jgi:hypothetical protein